MTHSFRVYSSLYLDIYPLRPAPSDRMKNMDCYHKSFKSDNDNIDNVKELKYSDSEGKLRNSANRYISFRLRQLQGQKLWFQMPGTCLREKLARVKRTNNVSHHEAKEKSAQRITIQHSKNFRHCISCARVSTHNICMRACWVPETSPAKADIFFVEKLTDSVWWRHWPCSLIVGDVFDKKWRQFLFLEVRFLAEPKFFLILRMISNISFTFKRIKYRFWTRDVVSRNFKFLNSRRLATRLN